ncbi:hypothetical protein XM48_16365 [Leucobacter sp. Ag1]|nr:hypothetical protein XM48_16365 [Leucobacter sp. Ag1]
MELLTAWVRLVPTFENVTQNVVTAFAPAAKEAEKSGDKAGKGWSNKAKAAMAGGAVAAGAVAAFKGLYDVGAIFDDVTDTIRTGTGAQGAALDGLVDVAKNVGTRVPAEFEKIGPTVADLNTRLGLSGKTLETVASQYLEAGRILGEDVDINKTSAAFSAFKIKGDDVSGAMDTLFQVSQATGVGMNDLASGVQTAAPALQNLGFGFEDSIALMGSLDKAGLNSTQVLGSMSKGLVALAKNGEQPEAAFKRVVGELQNFVKTGDTAGALNLAGKVFGTKGASQFVGALQSGALNMTDLMAATGATGDTILGVGEETMDFAERWQVTMNQAMVAIEPLASAVFAAVGDGMKAVMPFLKDMGAWVKENPSAIGILAGVIGVTLVAAFATWTASIWASTGALVANTAKMVGQKAAALANAAGLRQWVSIAGTQIATGVKSAATWVAGTAAMVGQKAALIASTVATKAAAGAQRLFNLVMNANPIMLVVTAVGTLVSGLIYFFTQTETGKKMWEDFTRFLGEAWTNIVSFAQDTWTNLGNFFSDLWANIQGIFQGVVDWVVDLFMNWTIYGLIIQNWGAIQQFFSDLWANITGFFQAAIDWVVDLFMNWTVYGLIIQNWDAISQFFVDLWNNIVGFFKGALDWIVNLFLNWTVFGFIIKNWTAIQQFFVNLWNGIVSTVRGAIGWVQSVIAGGIQIVKSSWESVWGSISSFFGGIWTKIKGTLDVMIGFVTKQPKAAFEAARDAIGKAWAGIQDLAKAPVKFVVETVINGLISAVNGFGLNIPKVKLPKGFAHGGILQGYDAVKRDTVMMPLRKGEGVLVPEAVRGLGADFIHAMNAAGNTGGPSAVRAQIAALGSGLARGGLVDPLPKGSWNQSQPWGPSHNGLDMAAPSGTKVFAASSGIVQLAGAVPMGGNEIYLQGVNGIGTRYSHLSRFAARAGQRVRQGQVIGYVGSTGMSTGPHLHYMVHNPGLGPNSYYPNTNPAAYLGVQGKDLGVGAGLFDGLIDGAVGQIKKAFPGGGIFVDLAGGMAKQAMKGLTSVFTSMFGSDTGSTGGRPMLYDNGGFLPPGLSIVGNKTGKPEPVFTAAQWDTLQASVQAPSSSGLGERIALVDADGSIIARLKVVAADTVNNSIGAASGSRLTARMGV